jgi:hypothetical protein
VLRRDWFGTRLSCARAIFGESCEPSGQQQCDRKHGVACSTQKTCEEIEVGASCALYNTANGISDVCGAGFFCDVHEGPPGACEATIAGGCVLQINRSDGRAAGLRGPGDVR